MQLTPIASNMTEVETSEARILFSYRTPVAAYIFGEGYVKTDQFWSVTTSRHINKWDGQRWERSSPSTFRQLGMKMQPLSTEVYETVLDLYESGEGFEFGIMNDLYYQLFYGYDEPD